MKTAKLILYVVNGLCQLALVIFLSLELYRFDHQDNPTHFQWAVITLLMLIWFELPSRGERK